MTSRVPDLDALRLLVGVAQHGSIGGAARAAGVTQQSASERLRAVEAQVGLPLVRRTPRGSELTDAGVVVVEWAARLLDLAEEIDTAIEGLRGDRGRELTVWSSMTVAESLVPRWMVRLRQRQLAEGRSPTTVSLTAANSQAVEEAVRHDGVHLGFVEGVEAPRGLSSAVVSTDELILVTAPGLGGVRTVSTVTPAQLARLILTTRETGSGSREVVERALAAHGLTLQSTVELTTNMAIRETVLAGGPAAFLSRRVVSRDLESGALIEVRTRGLDLTRSFRAVWAGGPHPPAGPVRELVDIATGRDQG